MKSALLPIYNLENANNMMKFRMPLFLLASLVVGPATVNAVIFNLSVDIGGISDAFPTDSVGLLVADTGSNGFQFLSDSSLLQGVSNTSVGALIGADDLIFATNLNFSENLFNLGSTSFNTSSLSVAWDAGDAIALVWFQAGTSNVGDSYGFYRSSSFDSSLGATIAFVTPSSGNHQIVDISTTLGGNTQLSGYTVNNNAIAAPIPEPASALLLGLGALGLVASRRRMD